MTRKKSKNLTNRRGNVAVLSVFLLSAIITMVAFSINMGNIANSLAQLQNAGDACGKSAAWKLLDEFDMPNAQTLATDQAVRMVQATMEAQGVRDTMIPATDMRFGRYTWDKVTNQFNVSWGTGPANLIQAKLSRIDPRRNALDVILRNILRRQTVELRSTTNVAFIPATGFTLPPGSTRKIGILPITLDLDTWIQLESGAFGDSFSVDINTGTVSSGSDGLREVKIFPVGLNKTLPSGNRGTLRLGANNNSTAKLSRQIVDGLNATDLSFHGGTLSVADGPLFIPGDPGVSAGIENDLISIIGQDRILPIFRSVSGNGANCTYEIVRFVGIKVLKADLRGALQHKEVIIQPSTFAIDDAITNMKMPFHTLGTVFVKPMYINVD